MTSVMRLIQTRVVAPRYARYARRPIDGGHARETYDEIFSPTHCADRPAGSGPCDNAQNARRKRPVLGPDCGRRVFSDLCDSCGGPGRGFESAAARWVHTNLGTAFRNARRRRGDAALRPATGSYGRGHGDEHQFACVAAWDPLHSGLRHPVLHEFGPTRLLYWRPAYSRILTGASAPAPARRCVFAAWEG